MQDQEKNRKNLIDTLRQDEVLQKAAVAALLERSDARYWSIMQQVNLVQSQLAALTNIELERRKLEINQQLVCNISSYLYTFCSFLLKFLTEIKIFLLFYTK